jgi:twinkle protein
MTGGAAVAGSKAKVTKELIPPGHAQALSARHINEATCEKFGYTISEFNGQAVQVAPYYVDGKLVAQKLRFVGKDFTVRGDLSDKPLFGQRLWRAGGKRLVITEGEIDALSYAQATNLSWPVVSVPNGASGAVAAIKANLEWLESFDQVVFMFDNDEPGQKAAHQCAELLTPGKAAVAVLPLKDANDMLKAGRVKELVSAAWEAHPKRPDGIVNASELWDDVNVPIEMGTPLPWSGLNSKLYGLRPREILTLTAGTNVGKSQVCSEIGYHLANKLEQNVGYVALEESRGRSALRFMALHANKPIHLPGNELGREEKERVFKETLGTGRYWLYDHFGSVDSDNLMGKLKYLVVGCGCKWLVLDHLSIVVSGMDLSDDERRAIDHTMTRLRQFTEETGAGLILVNHLRRLNGRSHEEGAQVSLSDLRGSQAIAQLSDSVVALERDLQVHTEGKSQTIVRVLKNRFSGQTGIAAVLQYDYKTGRLTETDFAVDDNGDLMTKPEGHGTDAF